MNDSLYTDVLLFEAREPQNIGVLPEPATHGKQNNPGCGDEIEVWVLLKDQKIQDIRWQGTGCVISQASASLLSEELKGKTVEQVSDMKIPDVQNLLGISEISPGRVRCALLFLQAVQSVIKPL